MCTQTIEEIDFIRLQKPYLHSRTKPKNERPKSRGVEIRNQMRQARCGNTSLFVIEVQRRHRREHRCFRTQPGQKHRGALPAGVTRGHLRTRARREVGNGACGVSRSAVCDRHPHQKAELQPPAGPPA
uniref:Uncharacterized protein n=1 Tax=Molossus molossus TaxID=27622 RepID=A0A7J8I152_MOLMO|nr:hypothetical protein HJG59_010893 [Molossus molossus]